MPEYAIYAHTEFIYVHICMELHLHAYIHHIWHSEMEDCVKVVQAVKILPEKLLSDSIGVTQGLK